MEKMPEGTLPFFLCLPKEEVGCVAFRRCKRPFFMVLSSEALVKTGPILSDGRNRGRRGVGTKSPIVLDENWLSR